MTDTPRPSPEDAEADREDGPLKKPDAAAQGAMQEAIERATAAVGSEEPPRQGERRDGQ